MGHLSNDDFLTQLKSLFDSQKTAGSVFLTEKRLTYEAEPAPGEDTEMMAQPEASTSAAASRQYPVIFRATNGKHPAHKIKISTIVQPADNGAFVSAYLSLLRSSFTTMRKKDKKKKDAKKAALKAAAAGKRGVLSRSQGAGLPRVVGPRRGAGHAKRQRSVKARAKAVKRHLDNKRRKEADVKYLTHLGKKVASGEIKVEAEST